MECRICNHDSESIFSTKVLNKYNVHYYLCSKCGFLQTEEPFWLTEAYTSSINATDTGLMARNIALSKFTAVLLFFLFDRNAKYLDYAGGYGIFTRLMRDIGFDFYWSDAYSQNLVARGFEYKENESVQLITSFECFEHFVDPIENLDKMLAISTNILFTTQLLPNAVPLPHDWWYYGLEHGQHISFYSMRTLKHIAAKYDLNLYSDGKSIHLLTQRRVNDLTFWLILKLKKRLYGCISKRMSGKSYDDMRLLLRK